MRIHLIKKQSIVVFAESNPGSTRPLHIWFSVIKYADWNTPGDILNTFGSADLLGNGCNRVVFDIGGNNYRMICKYYFGENEVHLFVCWLGTHAKYESLCKKGSQYTISKY